MRGAIQRFRHDEEEESSFVSMTDMTVSFLFIVMILLAFFATQYSEDDNVPRSLLEDMRKQRDQIVVERDSLKLQLAEVTNERDQLVAERDKLELQLEQVTNKLDAALEEIRRLTALLEKTERQRDELDDRLALAQEAVASLKREVTNRDQTIFELNQRIQELETQLAKFEQKDPLEAYLARAAAARLSMLERLRELIRTDFPDLLIEISAESDALRFQGEGLFRTNESALHTGPRRIVETISSRLNELLPCYTLGPDRAWNDTCNPGRAIIEAVQIEGHTDSQGAPLNNLTLSTARANSTFAAMLAKEPTLTSHMNFRDQPVLSVAGYGEMRPVASNDTPEGRRTNRRIDLRIIMYAPGDSNEIDRVRERLERPVDGSR